jgi:hypothetical protein
MEQPRLEPVDIAGGPAHAHGQPVADLDHDRHLVLGAGQGHHVQAHVGHVLDAAQEALGVGQLQRVEHLVLVEKQVLAQHALARVGPERARHRRHELAARRIVRTQAVDLVHDDHAMVRPAYVA